MNVVAINSIILSQMAKVGWWDYSQPNKVYRQTLPPPHEVNNGDCENWALKAQELFGGEVVWLDEFKSTSDWCHCVLRLGGRYYDSIHPDGARTLREFRQQARDYFRYLNQATNLPEVKGTVV